ncbi:MAG: NAD(P)H-binding protein [Gammaproteobacteria bacterium]|nr:NAD(P)H-binding protein [Gammaproteobacteria bacterium]
MNKTAIVIGSTGVVGRELIQQLLDTEQYNSVLSFSRSPLNLDSEVRNQNKLTEYLVEFDNPEQWQELVSGNDVFCCIGTTLKQAGSKEKQRQIDLELPSKFAHIAKQNGAEQFILVSSTGANPKSNSFYLRLKGKLEQAIINLDFKRTVIVRPSVIVGKRPDNRLGEKLSIVLLSALKWLPIINKFRPISGAQVAHSISQLAQQNSTSKLIIKELDELFND